MNTDNRPTPEAFQRQVRAQDTRRAVIAADFASRGPKERFTAAPKGLRATPPTEDEFAANYQGRNPLLCGFYVFVLYRQRKTRQFIAACYAHRDYGALLSRLDSPANREASRRGTLGFVPHDEAGDPCDWPSEGAVTEARVFRDHVSGTFATPTPKEVLRPDIPGRVNPPGLPEDEKRRLRERIRRELGLTDRKTP